MPNFTPSFSYSETKNHDAEARAEARAYGFRTTPREASLGKLRAFARALEVHHANGASHHVVLN